LNGPRGLAGSHTMILKINNLDPMEQAAVFIHEFGHVVDLGALTGTEGETGFYDNGQTIYANDVSSEFYSISWNSTLQRKAEQTQEDFVTGYAMTDPFEDFAESFTFYVLHGERFRLYAEHSSVLTQKYNFIKEHVFDGQEFFGIGKEPLWYSSGRTWDATKLQYDFDTFMNARFAL